MRFSQNNKSGQVKGLGDYSGHIAKAKHNEDFVAFISKHDPGANPVFPDWIVTAIFYTAVHRVDSKLAKAAPPPFDHPSNHADRNFAVSTYLPKISSYYFLLKSKSQVARYFVHSEKKIKQSLISACLGFLSKL